MLRVKLVVTTVITLLALVLVSSASLQAQDVTPEAPNVNPASEVARNTIMVSGMGTASGEPDVAYVEIGVDTVSADLTEAFDSANSRISAVIDAIVAMGIAREDIQTTYLNVYQEDIYDPNTGQNTGEFRFRVQNFIRVTVRDIDQAGEVVTTGVNAGANRVNGLYFGILDQTALASEARIDAVDNARQRAQELASAFGLQVGDVVYVQEVLGSDVFPAAYGRGGGMDVAQSVPVEGGQLQVSVQIEVVFELVSP